MDTKTSFYRTSAGTEINLVLEMSGGDIWAIEIKIGLTAKPGKVFYNAIEDIKVTHCFVVYAGEEQYHLTEYVPAIGLTQIRQIIDAL